MSDDEKWNIEIRNCIEIRKGAFQKLSELLRHWKLSLEKKGTNDEQHL